jgi:plasmid stability protein
MATLYVENVVDDLCQALRVRAKSQHRCIAAEVLWLCKMHIPTDKELKAGSPTGDCPMPTLCVENIPKDLYQALCKRAANNHRSVAAEVRTLLEQSVASKKELKKQCALGAM